MPRRRSAEPGYCLRRHGNGRWYVHWSERGRSRRVSCRTGERAEAERFLAAFRAGRHAAPAAPSVDEIIRAYWDQHGRHTMSAPNLRGRLERLRAEFGPLQPAQLAPGLIRAYHARLAARGLGPGSIALECRTLATALAWARRHGWLDAVPYVPRPRPPAPRERVLSREEAARLLAAATVPHVRLFVLIGLHTGARKGAILDLTWDRVDLERGRIDFAVPDRPRTGKRRAVVPVNDTLRAALARARQLARSDWVIEWGGERIGRDIRVGFDSAVRRAGLEGVTPHTLRHTAASRMAGAGVPLWSAAETLAMSPETLRRVYAHYEPAYGQAAVAALE